MSGIIFDIKEMAVHDGPGIRTTVFLKGCPLRCVWCHNPEGLDIAPQLVYRDSRCLKCGRCLKKCDHEECKPFSRCLHACPEGLLSISGKNYSAKELMDELLISKKVLGNNFGGVTFSGGEPLMQYGFLLETAELLKDINICIETSGFAEQGVFNRVLEVVDFVIMDIKLADSELHKKYTGVSNEIILKNFETLKKSGKPHIIRTPLVPNITDTENNLRKIKEIIGDSKWEKLPYNNLAGAKYKMLGMEFPMDSIKALS